MGGTQALTARQVLEGVFSYFEKNNGGNKVKLPTSVKTEIADDSDWHRTRKGYCKYNSVVLVKLDDKEWAIAFGTACGSYPSEEFDCDITAIPIVRDGKPDEKVLQEISLALERSSYFRNSLAFALYDGQLAGMSTGKYSEAVRLIGQKLESLIAKPMEIDSEHMFLDGRPVVKSSRLYKRKTINFLVDVFCSVLRKQ